MARASCQLVEIGQDSLGDAGNDGGIKQDMTIKLPFYASGLENKDGSLGIQGVHPDMVVR
jgi:hypothetical protein